jgi:hypothetical protein
VSVITGHISSLEAELNLPYLQAEISRIDVLIRREVRLWQLVGQDPSDAFRGLAITAQTADELSNQPFGANWGSGASLPKAEEAVYQHEIERITLATQEIRQQALSQKVELRLHQLVQIFTLNSFELDAFLICLAPALDLRYERLYGFLQDNVTLKQASVNLILSLLCSQVEQRFEQFACFQPNAPLFKHHLLEWGDEKSNSSGNLLSRLIKVDPAIASWLLGRYHPTALLGSTARLEWPVEDDTDALLAAKLDEQFNLTAATACKDYPPALLGFFGPDLPAQHSAARQLALKLGCPLFSIDLASAAAGDDFPEIVRRSLRDARLNGAIPCFSGWDACLLVEQEVRGGEQQKGIPSAVPAPEILADLCAFPGWVIISSQNAWHAAGIQRDKPFLWAEFAYPNYSARQLLWKHFLGQPADNQPDAKIAALAGQFMLTGSQIRDAVATARDLSAQQGHPLGIHDLFSAARIHSHSMLGGLARKIEPRFSWQDIILPSDQLTQLHEVVSTVGSRPLVLEQWGVGKKLVPSSGIPILFAGPPGTGKTMAAEVIANELGLDLYKIELSGVVSKYIGETEKNLERIFDEAEQSNAILFFDEADAIFGKRSEVKDAHDRYANIETSYLLQRMEMYGGVTILATNLRANLDQAFTRRLQFVIDFPFPEEEDRYRIWKTLFPASIPHDPELDFHYLAHSYRLAGGNIRNIIVSAAYMAATDGQSVTLDHLLHGVKREMQKMGRLVDEKTKKA